MLSFFLAVCDSIIEQCDFLCCFGDLEKEKVGF
jgi:hypothetical protein